MFKWFANYSKFTVLQSTWFSAMCSFQYFYMKRTNLCERVCLSAARSTCVKSSLFACLVSDVSLHSFVARSIAQIKYSFRPYYSKSHTMFPTIWFDFLSFFFIDKLDYRFHLYWSNCRSFCVLFHSFSYVPFSLNLHLYHASFRVTNCGPFHIICVDDLNNFRDRLFLNYVW